MVNLKQQLLKIKSVIQKLSPYPAQVKILAVTKKRTVEEIKEAIKAGITCFGENYLQEAEDKFGNWEGEKKFQLHMIGHLQANKVRKALEIFDCIQSVDSYKLAERISRTAGEFGRKMPIFIQVNLSEKPERYGFQPSLLKTNMPPILALKNIEVRGFMLVAPKDADLKSLRKSFQEVKKLTKEFGLKEISAGMSNDFPIALEEGTSVVRLGSAIFGTRPI